MNENEKMELTRFLNDLGKRIKFLREERGMTQLELGDKIGKDFQSVSRIENGKINSSAFIIKSIADALQVGMDELFVK